MSKRCIVVLLKFTGWSLGKSEERTSETIVKSDDTMQMCMALSKVYYLKNENMLPRIWNVLMHIAKW